MYGKTFLCQYYGHIIYNYGGKASSRMMKRLWRTGVLFKKNVTGSGTNIKARQLSERGKDCIVHEMG